MELAWSTCNLDYMINEREKRIPRRDFFTKEKLNKNLTGGEVIDVKYSEDETVPSEVAYRTNGKKYYEYRIQITADGEVSVTETGIGDSLASSKPPEEGWTVEQAKEIVARDGLKAHLGEKVAYNPTGGGTWRIFYYDNENQGNGKGYFGDDVGTVYLKRDCGADMISLQEYNSYNPTDGGAVMKQMNPKWAKSSISEIDTESEHSVAWLCDPAKWTNYKVEGVAKYAIGTPSLEMFAKSYNIYGGSGAEIVTKIVPGTLYFDGYRPGLNGRFADDHTLDFRDGSLEAGPEGVFITPGVPGHWLSSMNRQIEVLTVNGDKCRFGSNYSTKEECKAGVAPVVALL